jgi:hypothetical protein
MVTTASWTNACRTRPLSHCSRRAHQRQHLPPLGRRQCYARLAVAEVPLFGQVIEVAEAGAAAAARRSGRITALSSR